MQTASKKVINGWAMYDWANSVYNLVITTTFFPIYFASVAHDSPNGDTITFLGKPFLNSSLYNYCLAVAYLIIALSYPILTSIADTRGNKKNFMRFFCYLGAVGCGILFLFKDVDSLGLGITGFMMAAMGYVGSLVFYNAYLPEIAAPEDRDRVSAKGFSYGYIGSVIMQVAGFALVIGMKGNEGMAMRITFLLVGFWWLGFAQFAFSRLPNNPVAAAKKKGNVFRDGFTEMKKIYSEVKLLPVLKRFLRGFFFYSIGVQTVMLAATMVGSQLLHLDEIKLISTIVIIQLVAIPGAILMSRLSARFGNIRVLMGVVFFWIMICIAAFVTSSKALPLAPHHEKIKSITKLQKEAIDAGNTLTANEYQLQIDAEKAVIAPAQRNIEFSFYGLAVCVGLVMGGIQSLSRSTYAKLMPETKDTASYFTYYDLTEKIAIVIGMFCFGYIAELVGMEFSVLSLTVFFGLGFLFLYFALIKQKRSEPIDAETSL